MGTIMEYLVAVIVGCIIALASRAASANGRLGFSLWQGLQVPLIMPAVAVTVALLTLPLSGPKMAATAVLAIGGPIFCYYVGRRQRRTRNKR